MLFGFAFAGCERCDDRREESGFSFLDVCQPAHFDAVVAFVRIVVQPFVAMKGQGMRLDQPGPVLLVPGVAVLPFPAVDAGVGLKAEVVFLDAEAGDEPVAVAVGISPLVVSVGQCEHILRHVVPKLDSVAVVGQSLIFKERRVRDSDFPRREEFLDDFRRGHAPQGGKQKSQKEGREKGGTLSSHFVSS